MKASEARDLASADAARRPVSWRMRLAACSVVSALLTATGSTQQDLPRSGDELTGLEWTFVRIRYGSPADQLARFRRTYWSDPWAIDAPAAEQNLTRRMGRVTTITVNDPLILELSDERLWEYLWIYFVEPANLEFTEAEVPIVREFLLRGGTATFDDFHGPIEWDLFARQMKRVFPDRGIVDLTAGHPIFSCFYELDAYPQIPGLGSFFNGVTWEKGGFEPRLRGIRLSREIRRRTAAS